MEIWFSILLLSMATYLTATTSGIFSEKSGVVNIAIEGMMIIGALTYAIFLNKVDPNGENSGMQYVALIFVIIAGILFSLLLSLGAVTFMGDHIIVATALNMIAPALAILITKSLNDNNELITLNNYDDFLIMGKSGHFLIFLVIAAIIVLISWLIFSKTSFGLRIKAAGENPHSLAAAGVNVNKIRYQAVMISGALASIAGAFAVNMFSSFTGTMNGVGYIAIALLIMSQWNLALIPFVTLLFSVVYSLSYSYDTLVFVQNIPKIVFEIMPFVLPIITMMIFKSKGAPKALGKSYNKEQR